VRTAAGSGGRERLSLCAAGPGREGLRLSRASLYASCLSWHAADLWAGLHSCLVPLRGGLSHAGAHSGSLAQRLNCCTGCCSSRQSSCCLCSRGCAGMACASSQCSRLRAGAALLRHCLSLRAELLRSSLHCSSRAASIRHSLHCSGAVLRPSSLAASRARDLESWRSSCCSKISRSQHRGARWGDCCCCWEEAMKARVQESSSRW
jgi:hypothetical protein